MKSAEEWIKEYEFCGGETEDGDLMDYIFTESDIKQIQLDAIKEGMTQAAEICINEGGTIHTCKQAILNARDNLKELV